MTDIACKVCNNTENNKIIHIREMFLGLREVFDYLQCGNCGCVQIISIPADLGRYYPADKYYSFKSDIKGKVSVDTLRKIKAEYLLFNKNKVLGKLLSIGYKTPEYFDWLKRAGVTFNDAILDVGCGNGGLLTSLNKIGFRNLTGADPFNDKDLDYGDVKIYKKDIFHLGGSFDFIMLNHAFEHMDEPKAILERLYKLLKPGKLLLIRTPVMGTYAWETYKENWMNLDAPRHLIIHTEKSIDLLAQQTGFEVKDVVYDQIEISLIGSEQYSRDISLLEPQSYIVNKQTDIFTAEEIENFKKVAQQKNKERQGDQAAFYLYKK